MAEKWSVVIVVLLMFGGIQCQIISGPEATADLVGSTNVELNCTVPTTSTATMVWKYNPRWGVSTGVPLYDPVNGAAPGVEVNYTFTETPLTDGSSNTEYVLGIKTLTADLAVLYECSAGQGIAEQTITAEVLAMNEISCTSSDFVYTEGDIGNLTCNVSYHNWNAIAGVTPPTPTLSMNDPSGTLLNSTSSPSGSPPDLTLRLLTHVEMLPEYDNTEITCTVNFQTTPPTYEQSCTTILQVYHGVTEVTITTPDGNDPPRLEVDQVINCTSNGRPEPDLTWSDENGVDLVSTNGELVVTEEMASMTQPLTYTCTANNTLDDGITYFTANSSITFYAIPIPGVQSNGTPAWVIAVAVVVPIVVIAAAVIIGFFVYRKYYKKPKKTTKTNGAYSAAATTDPAPIIYGRPTTVPRTNSYGSQPPGPDNRNANLGTDSPAGHGDMGINPIRPYGSNQDAVNATLNSSRSSLGAVNAAPLLLPNPARAPNPKPNYPYTGSNPALNGPQVSMNQNPPGPRNGSAQSAASRPTYPYTGSNPALNASGSANINLNPTPGYNNVFAPARQPSVVSSSSRSVSSYGGPPPADSGRPFPANDLSSMHGSEV